jgi:hypothetical protein
MFFIRRIVLLVAAVLFGVLSLLSLLGAIICLVALRPLLLMLFFAGVVAFGIIAPVALIIALL